MRGVVQEWSYNTGLQPSSLGYFFTSNNLAMREMYILKETLKRGIASLFSFSMLVVGGCAATNNLPVDSPRAMIEYYSDQIENQCDILVSGDPKGREECRRKQSYYYHLNYQEYQSNYGQFKINRVYDMYYGRCSEYYKIGDYQSAIADCRKAFEVAKWTDGIDMKNKALHLRALTEFKLSDYRAVIASLERLKEAPPNYGCPSSTSPQWLENLTIQLNTDDWSNCRWITESIQVSKQNLSTAIAEHNENIRKHEAYKSRMKKLEEEKQAIEYAKKEAEREKQRKLREAARSQAIAEEKKRQAAYLERQKAACSASQNLNISTVFWENIVNQYGLNPYVKNYEVKSASPSRMSYYFQGADPEKMVFWCDVKIYLKNGVCKATAKIVGNKETGFFSPLGGNFIFHTDAEKPCEK